MNEKIKPRHALNAPQKSYLLRESDLERIDRLIGSLNLAITEIFLCREIQDCPEDLEDRPALREFDSEVILVLNEAELQRKPGGYASDF